MGYSFPLLPPNLPKNQNFGKIKKKPKDIIIFNRCTKIYDQMMYGSWDMVCDRCNCYFSFWAIIFTPLSAQKVKILKKWKKCMDISSFYIGVPKIMIRWCTVPEIWCVTDVIVISHFGLFFALLHLEISSLYICVPKIMIRWCTVPEIWCMMDGQKKWHIEVGAPPNNKFHNIKIIKRMYYQTKNFDVNFHCLKHTKKRNTLCSNYWVLHHILMKNQRLNKQLI